METINIYDFIKKYDEVKEKKAFVKRHIYRNYCPILEKQLILKTMIDKSIGKTEHDVKFLDLFLADFNLQIAKVILYTDIDINEVSSFEAYDMLTEKGILKMIDIAIGENELISIENIYSLLKENFNNVNSSTENTIRRICDKYIDTFAITVNSALEEIVKVSGDENKMKGIVERFKNLIGG